MESNKILINKSTETLNLLIIEIQEKTLKKKYIYIRINYANGVSTLGVIALINQ